MSEPHATPGPARTLFLAAAAMLAFAANSLLCRRALGGDLIDAASFATIRVVSGALTLGLLMWPRWRSQGRRPVDWRTVLALYAYVAFFSFAYLSLDAGTGALILFGAVQLTMFIAALLQGEHFPPVAWGGFVLAVAGLAIAGPCRGGAAGPAPAAQRGPRDRSAAGR